MKISATNMTEAGNGMTMEILLNLSFFCAINKTSIYFSCIVDALILSDYFACMAVIIFLFKFIFIIFQF